ncbi:MAG: amidohydrolase [Candidatus Marinimicrobia bacterium]|nr:amidohydrolase [Candidatus Neomarinimicrobiota bacterium]
MPKLNIHPAIAKLEKRIIALRRHFHQHPELSFQETETAQSILAELKGLNLEVRHPVARTGIVAVLRNGNGPCIALRADMDALPIQETGDRPYKSVNDGVMHACGHDGHLAILLGTLLALENSRDLWRGTLKFIFQPAEEGPAGARYMVEEGVLKEPKVRAIFGLHLWNYQDFGTIGVKAGPVMAAADRFTITVRGKGGHGAMPQGTVDAVIVAAQLVMSLQSIVSRNLNPLESGVVTVGQIHGGDNFNIIADEVTLTGTARAYREEDRQLIKSRIKAICDGTAASHGAAIELDYQDGYPPTINDPAMTEVAVQAARQVVGDGAGDPFRSMGGEDMAYFLQEVPGCFFFIGSAKPEHPEGAVPHHSSHFDFDERALTVGASMFVAIIQALLPPSG